MTKLGLSDGEWLLNAGASLFVDCGINAFGHRLIESGQSVEVAIYRSFIEIYSPGKFPEGMTPEMFIREIRKPIRRNPLITRTLYYSKDMESFATGLKRIQDACDEAGCMVEYYGDNYGFTVRFYRHCGEGWGDEHKPAIEINDKGRGQDKEQVGEQVTEQVTEQNRPTEALILEFCAATRTRKEIQTLLGFSGRRHFSETYLKPLLECGN